MSKKYLKAALISAVAITLTPAAALADDDVELVRCDESIGTIALVDGAGAGWSQWNLGSPRALIARLATESGCFTPHAGGAEPARFLMTAVAGTEEEVDQTMELARGAAGEALLRSGAASSILRNVPFGGSALGMLGGLGGRLTVTAAGLTVVSPSNGQQLATGTGSVSKSTLSFRGNSGSWARDIAGGAGYGDSKEGRQLTEAYIIAFNQLVAQRSALEAAPQAGAPAASAEPAAIAAVETTVRAGPSGTAAEVRSLRAGTELKPTGNRDGLWIEAEDNFGTRGWVSAEDLQ